MAPYNECDACHEQIPHDAGAFCAGDHCPTVEDEWDRFLDRYDDIGVDE